MLGFTLLSCSCGEDSVEGSKYVMVAIKIYKNPSTIRNKFYRTIRFNGNVQQYCRDGYSDLLPLSYCDHTEDVHNEVQRVSPRQSSLEFQEEISEDDLHN